MKTTECINQGEVTINHGAGGGIDEGNAGYWQDKRPSI